MTSFEHALAASATVVIGTLDTAVRLRAVDGTVARVHLANGDLATYFRIDAGTDRLEIRPVRRWGLGWHRARGPLDVEVPRDARIEVRSASGPVLGIDLVAGTRVRTASGEVDLAGVAGDVSVSVVSGSVRITAASVVALDITSVSGRVDVDAASASRVKAVSMSGAIRLMASLRGAGPYSLESVSGEIVLGTEDGLRIAASSVSGAVRSEVPGWGGIRSGGRRNMAIGAAGPEVGVRTVSGRIRMVPLTKGPTWPGGPSPSVHTGSAQDEPPVAGVAPDPDDDPRLPILRALERGEISVEEAEARIDGLEVRGGG
jgi:hypothetical protein